MTKPPQAQPSLLHSSRSHPKDNPLMKPALYAIPATGRIYDWDFKGRSIEPFQSAIFQPADGTTLFAEPYHDMSRPLVKKPAQDVVNRRQPTNHDCLFVIGHEEVDIGKANLDQVREIGLGIPSKS